MAYFVEPIGAVHSPRRDPGDSDQWGDVTSTITVDARFPVDCLTGLDRFSHVEVIYLFHQARERDDWRARPSRGRTDLPPVGVFADRGPRRPNRLGATICRVVDVDERRLTVRGLDAIHGTPVIDIKPVMTHFLPTGVQQPTWVDRLMADYFATRPTDGLDSHDAA